MSPEDRMEALRGLLGLRSHREGCPGEDAGGGRIEGYEETVRAPGNELKGIEPDTPVVVRCMECAGVRYLPGQRLVELLERAQRAQAATS